MATKQERYKKLPPLKVKRVTASSLVTKEPKSKTKKAEIVLDQEKAAYELTHRATKDFTREELGSLMQVPPGGAEPHQIKTQSRQFSRVASSMPEAVASDPKIGLVDDRKKAPMSVKTPKIDKED